MSDCSRCETPLERGDLRCAICGLSAPARGRAETEHTVVQILRCTGCGAAVSYSTEAQAPACGFCDSVLEVESVEDPMEQTELFLPFSIPPETARAALTAWFGTLGFFRVQDLKSKTTLESLKPMWWVGWVFVAEALISWTADSDAGAGVSGWAPHSGQREMSFDGVLVSASRGLSNEETFYLADSYDLGSARTEPAGAEGAIVEQFDVQRSMARQKVVEAVEAIAASRVVGECVPGSRYRNLHAAALLRGLTTRRFAFPAYVLAYRYRRKLYRVVVSGQSARYVKGDAPYDWLRILAAVLLLLALIPLALGIIALVMQ